MMLIVRREGQKLKRYIHLGTGNYHAGNARLYTDYSLMTSHEDMCEDVHKIFQELTGMGRAAKLSQIHHSPFTLHGELLRLIDNERTNALQGLPAKIVMKCNSLTAKQIIQALYRASQAGVTIKLIVRGMCALRPGIAGVSDNIEVRSVIGRFLEHTRVYYFQNNTEPQVFCTSADLMERNLLRRVETCYPILDKKLANRVIADGLKIFLQDNCQAWKLAADGSYEKLLPKPDEPRICAQEYLIEKHGK